MITERDECCGCATESYPCLGDSYPRRHTAVLICDECGDEVEKLYKVDGMQLCSRCALNELEEVDYERERGY